MSTVWNWQLPLMIDLVRTLLYILPCGVLLPWGFSYILYHCHEMFVCFFLGIDSSLVNRPPLSGIDFRLPLDEASMTCMVGQASKQASKQTHTHKTTTKVSTSSTFGRGPVVPLKENAP